MDKELESWLDKEYGQALASACKDNPSDALSWNVYADWLLDNGQTEDADTIRQTIAITTNVSENKLSSVSDLRGKWISKVEQIGDDILQFTLAGGDVYRLCHHQDCCESVYIEDVCGQLSDLENTTLLMAEEAVDRSEEQDEYSSRTWTFYKFGTIKGYVTIRWLGESNGYYSESVDFEPGR